MENIETGKEAFYDDEKELYYCYIGIKDKVKTLVAAVYGNTPNTAFLNASRIASKLNNLKTNKDEKDI